MEAGRGDRRAPARIDARARTRGGAVRDYTACVAEAPVSKLEKSVVAVVGVLALLALLDFLLVSPNSSRVRATLQTVRDTAVDQYERLTGQPAPPEAPAAPVPSAVESRPRREPPVVAPAEPVIPSDSSPPTIVSGSPGASANARPVSSPAPAAARRGEFYLPGRTSTWTGFDVTISSPTVIRAGGRVVAGTDSAGPDGLLGSDFERRLGNQRPDDNQRVLPSAAYLALIARVCSTMACSEPFLIGSRGVLCPSDLKVKGNLQFLTNNYVRVEGMQTSLNYSKVSGGYSFYMEPAPAHLCSAGAAPPAEAAASIDAAALEKGLTLNNREFTISSSQSSWKPFFLPLASPLLLRASGSMRPRGGVEPTDPRGITVPAGTSWAYPGTRDLVVDATHHLYDPSLPYQALIGRLCGPTECGAPFLVGTERVICPAPPMSDRLELWINHIIGPAGLLGSQTPLTLDALELQQRSGTYRFEISRAPASACAG
jgi:hypothetical protein